MSTQRNYSLRMSHGQNTFPWVNVRGWKFQCDALVIILRGRGKWNSQLHIFSQHLLENNFDKLLATCQISQSASVDFD